MKTLINKHNPEIRITAPEIEEHEEEQMYLIPVSDYCIPMCIDDWALVEEEPTCRSCGFYENNCPFIRGKFVPYPSRVCKDYIHSAMKEQEQPEVDLEKAAKEYAKINDKSSITKGFSVIKFAAFKAGAEWQRIAHSGKEEENDEKEE